ncbi:hypothetical protein Tco_0837249 [Tanacetum coccineum]
MCPRPTAANFHKTKLILVYRPPRVRIQVRPPVEQTDDKQQNQGHNPSIPNGKFNCYAFKIVLLLNTASTSGSGTLPGNTVTNPKEDLKGITTRSGVTIQGPKACNHDTEVTKDTMPPADNGSTEDVQPPVIQIQTHNPNPEPNVAPVVTPAPKASIPFPSRRKKRPRKKLTIISRNFNEILLWI